MNTLASTLEDMPQRSPVLQLRDMVQAGLAALPMPGQGDTLSRWRALATVASFDLSLAKIYESHADAAAILQELEGEALPEGTTWGVWCAEPPQARVVLKADTQGVGRLQGIKAWCSGAGELTHALVSAWNEAGDAVLAAVDLTQPGVTVTQRGWHAVGMAATGSVDVEFDNVPARQIGDAGSYTARAGFWMGGAGIAACWWGAARAIGSAVRKACTSTQGAAAPDPHRLAHLGAIDVALSSAAALMRESARVMDRPSSTDDQRRDAALRLRLCVEDAARTVVDRAGRALGAAPLCRDATFARLMADLPVFLRQSHAERDLAGLGASVAQCRAAAWVL